MADTRPPAGAPGGCCTDDPTLRGVEDLLADVLGDLAATVPVAVAPSEDPAGVLGLVLAEDVRATAPLPGFDNAAMDGYAVDHRDVADATPDAPVTLPVVGAVAAGSGGAPPRVARGRAVRIMTGARMPPGATAVVPWESTDRGSARVEVHHGVHEGRHVRRTGEDVACGDLVVAAGTTLRARHLGVLAALDVRTVRVHPAPRVAVVATGSELQPAGEPLRPDGIRDSGATLVGASVVEAGGVVMATRTVPDDPAALEQALAEVAPLADLVVTTGGVSEGDHDVVRLTLAGRGSMWFGRIAMQPGKPQGFGRLEAGGPLLCCLPGNPVASFTSFHVLVRPALARLRGASVAWPTSSAVLATDLDSPADRLQLVRATLEHGDDLPRVTPGGTASHMVGALARSDVLVVVPVGVTRLSAGATVTVLRIDPEPL
ncbi:molybdopterin molybdotransferase MoeA [Nocardioides zeae]|uniref:Molybdopterin molybdenumtransferase n=1 Tax=Nocardioides zeae TaxID=1457234 RepID=A0AAJ1U601_9ACTN|nr:gephyrin-like molybdotransferase Glp [Nocardioides zeae]MDQ1105913.1 molybdopterin molybdotransferase [Nocardioides zeae]